MPIWPSEGNVRLLKTADGAVSTRGGGAVTRNEAGKKKKEKNLKAAQGRNPVHRQERGGTVRSEQSVLAHHDPNLSTGRKNATLGKFKLMSKVCRSPNQVRQVADVLSTR